MSALLEIEELVTEFGDVRAVDGVSLELEVRKTLGIVGESGSGKSTLALSIMRLVAGAGRVRAKRLALAGRDVLAMTPYELRALRGDRVAMIFQEPMTSLNPVFTVGGQIAEAVRLHQGASRGAANAAAIAMLELVGIPSPRERARAYPHQLSGGMRQRVMIAMALACKPDLLIADEPTTALDVTIQAQILELLGALQRELGMALLLITHDLGVVADACDEVIVMYAGRIVERAPTAALFATPRHHYTDGLLRAMHELREIPGSVPARLPAGCKFAPRCSAAQDKCRAEEPALVQLGASQVRCHFPVAAA